MLKKILLIDANGIGYAAQDMRKLYVGYQQTQAVFGFLKSMRVLLKKYPSHVPIILWDGKAKWRYDLFPQYKGNRNADPNRIAEKEAYKTQTPYIRSALNSLGVTQITVTNAEADDMAGYMSKKLSLTRDIVLISSDKDWCQLVDKKVSWYDPRFDRSCTIENFAEFTGYATPDQFVEAKALVGDGSDNIPGVGGIGEKGAPDFLMQYGSAYNFLKMSSDGNLPKKMIKSHARLANNESPPDSKKYGKMAPAQDAFHRNMKLMDLRCDFRPDKSKVIKDIGKLDRKKFIELSKELMFRSIYSNIDNWIEPFESVARR